VVAVYFCSFFYFFRKGYVSSIKFFQKQQPEPKSFAHFEFSVHIFVVVVVVVFHRLDYYYIFF